MIVRNYSTRNCRRSAHSRETQTTSSLRFPPPACCSFPPPCLTGTVDEARDPHLQDRIRTQGDGRRSRLACSTICVACSGQPFRPERPLLCSHRTSPIASRSTHRSNPLCVPGPLPRDRPGQGGQISTSFPPVKPARVCAWVGGLADRPAICPTRPRYRR